MTNNKNLSFSKVMFKGAFIYNPVLTQAIGICTIVAIGITLKLSLIFSVIISVLLIIMEILSSLILKKLSRWLRISTYMILSTLILLPLMLFMDKNLSELSAAMGIYLPLLAVNSIIVIRCEIFAVKNKVRNSFFDALAASVGFIAVSILTGFLREFLAYGTIFGKTVPHLPAVSGMALPFGGIMVLGFLAAFHKWLIQKISPRYPTNTFNLRTAFDMPALKNEGINATDGTLSFINDPVATGEETNKPASEYSDAEKAIARNTFIVDADNDSDEVSLDEINILSEILKDETKEEKKDETEGDKQ